MSERVLSLFRFGFDTFKIAEVLRMKEHEVDRLLSRQLSADRGLPPPVVGRSSSLRGSIGIHSKSSSG